MAAVGDRLHAAFSWLTSPGSFFNLTSFDALSIPFTDTSFASAIADRNGAMQTEREQGVVYVDQSGRQMSEAELDTIGSTGFNDSPWGFVASRYALTLGIMAVVVNRITHICRPQGRPRPLPGSRRLGIQLPTMMFLSWSGFLLLLITLNSFSDRQAFLQKSSIQSWLPADVRTLLIEDHEQADVHAANSTLLWRLFLSVCFAVVSSTLLRTLEGHNTIVNPDDLGNSPTFNLVGFAVLLHLHASSHAFPPNKHVYLSILFQVGEVLGLQACTCWSTPPISRLTLTSFFGLTSTVHYLLAIRSGDRGYPFLQSFSRAPDVALIAIILLTLFLHTLTALITSTPLSFQRLIDPRSLPLPTDDYSLALFKLGTACLSSTKLSGMDADMIDIRTATESWVEINGGHVHVRQGDGTLAKSGQYGVRNGLSNEIRRIRTSSKSPSSGGPSPFRSALFYERWQFVVTLFRTIRGLLVWTGHKLAAFLPFDLPVIRTPAFVRRVPRLVRLAWHGTNGEQRRQRLIDERRQQEERRNAIEADRAHRDRLEGAGRAFGTSSSSYPAGPLSGSQRGGSNPAPLINSPPNSWHRYLVEQDFGDDDEEDGDWVEEIVEEDSGVAEERRPVASQAMSWTSAVDSGNTQDYWNQLGRGARLQSEEVEGLAGDDEQSDDDDAWQDDDGQEIGEMSAELLSLARRDFDDEMDEDEPTTELRDGSIEQHSYARILLAHLSSPRSRILTRGGYRDLMGIDQRARADAEILADVIRQRRTESNINALRAASSGVDSASAERERMRLCVICYAEDRTIICWPCKCLALCDACREAMATRPPPRAGHQAGSDGTAHAGAATHTCPTCRTPVMGFSRIFLP